MPFCITTTTQPKHKSAPQINAARNVFFFLQSFEFRINIQRWPAKQRRILLFSMRDFVCHTSPLSRFLALALRMTTWLAFHLLLPALYFAFFSVLFREYSSHRARESLETFRNAAPGGGTTSLGACFSIIIVEREKRARRNTRFDLLPKSQPKNRGCKNAMCFNGFSCYSWCSAWWKIIAVNCTSTRRAVLRECFLCKFVWKNFHVYVMEFRMPRSEDSLVRNIESMHLQDAGENRLWKYLSPGKGSKS